MKLYKTIMIVWSEKNIQNKGLTEIALGAEIGDLYCSSCNTELVKDVKKDKDWDNNEFFEGVENENN